MSFVKVRESLATAAVATLQAAPIEMEAAHIISGNMPSPRINEPWAQILFVPRSPTVATMGDGGMDRVEGVLLVNIRTPLDKGEVDGLVAVDAFRSAFPAGSRLIFEGQEVTVLSIGAVDGRVVDGFWRTDITIPYRAFIQRGT